MIDLNVGFNTQLNTLKKNLINTINDSGLPIGICYYIVKDVLTDVTNSYKETLISESNNKNTNE